MPGDLMERQTLARWARHDDRMRAIERTTASPRSLYAPTFDETMARVIRADFSKYLEIPEPAQVLKVPEQEPGAWHECGEGIPCCDCGSFDLHDLEHPNGWGCERCSKPVTRIAGCIACLRVVCWECVRLKRPDGRFARSLREIGMAMGGRSPERVRQVEAKALRKLRHESRAKFLREFWEGA